jgi:peptide chain release factor 1
MQKNDTLIEKLNAVKSKFIVLERKLSEGFSDQQEFIKLSKEYSDLKEIIPLIDEYFACVNNMEQSESLMSDVEMKELAEAEFYSSKEKLPDIEQQIKIALLPKDAADEKNAILEIRGGTGGDEAAIFAGNLFNMYVGYANTKGWTVDVVDANESEAGGFKEIIAKISGTNVFAELKFESGVHRVQRVPETESQGRVHTSAATVAIMPEASAIDIQIRPEDLRIDTYRASGAGGQHVNKTDSAVRITHLPTNTVAQCQQERSQIQNREKCFEMLYTKLYDLERQKADDAMHKNRKSQVGSGDRSERIRTYNYPQSRVSDHRINLTLYKLSEIMTGAGLQEIIDALKTADQLERLGNLE